MCSCSDRRCPFSKVPVGSPLESEECDLFFFTSWAPQEAGQGSHERVCEGSDMLHDLSQVRSSETHHCWSSGREVLALSGFCGHSLCSHLCVCGVCVHLWGGRACRVRVSHQAVSHLRHFPVAPSSAASVFRPLLLYKAGVSGRVSQRGRKLEKAGFPGATVTAVPLCPAGG